MGFIFKILGRLELKVIFFSVGCGESGWVVFVVFLKLTYKPVRLILEEEIPFPEDSQVNVGPGQSGSLEQCVELVVVTASPGVLRDAALKESHEGH